MKAGLPISRFGFVRVAVATPELRVADVTFNTRAIIQGMQSVARQGGQMVVFPELCLTGYSCGDLFYQNALIEAARFGLEDIARATSKLKVAAVVGLPWSYRGKLYNVSAFLNEGRLLGIVPRIYDSPSGPFSSAAEDFNEEIECGKYSCPFGPDVLFQQADMSDCRIAIVPGDDLRSVVPLSSRMALQGATLLINPSADEATVGHAQMLTSLVQQQSARCRAAYLHASAGPWESSTDGVFSGHSMICENGKILAETRPLRFESSTVIADIDMQLLANARTGSGSFTAGRSEKPVRTIGFSLRSPKVRGNLLRPITKTPFIPDDPAEQVRQCEELFAIQSTALARRLLHIGAKKVVVGISGGLDSTLTLLVSVKAFKTLKLPAKNIHAVTMPGFGTSGRTKNNASLLARELGLTLRTIPIVDAVRGHFRDIGHDVRIHDETYENAQARERTQILMDLANRLGALMLGTGDLSEEAMGYCTYNGDHMAMYNINAGVPKTVIRHLVEWIAGHEFKGRVSATLRDICATPISPELLPLSKEGVQHQHTEKRIGPYELHEFFLYYMIQHHFAPRKIRFLAQQAFGEKYSQAEITRWLKFFYQRFFANQFKRSAAPDGPKAFSFSLSPRGDWKMPSDASSATWRDDLNAL